MDQVERHPDAVILESSKMSWDADSKKLVAEASTVGFDWVGYLWKYSPDRGVYVRSHRTGHMEPFVLLRADKDPEGDTRYWEFASTKHGILLTLFND